MTEIEKRANEYIGHPFEVDESTPVTMARLAYIKGATEQKKIDIEKAIKAHCSFCKAHNACVDRGEFYCPETEHIKKTMEE